MSAWRSEAPTHKLATGHEQVVSEVSPATHSVSVVGRLVFCWESISPRSEIPVGHRLRPRARWRQGQAGNPGPCPQASGRGWWITHKLRQGAQGSSTVGHRQVRCCFEVARGVVALCFCPTARWGIFASGRAGVATVHCSSSLHVCVCARYLVVCVRHVRRWSPAHVSEHVRACPRAKRSMSAFGPGRVGGRGKRGILALVRRRAAGGGGLHTSFVRARRGFRQ